jgi:hypothetical protein
MFAYSNSPYPIRADIPDAHRHAWDKIAAPGSWWTGAQRVAIAAETRGAANCELCATRKQALSPQGVAGNHDRVSQDELSDTAVDAVHRLATDASRMSESWLQQCAQAGLSDAHYVELLGVVVALVSIDAFHAALGFPVEPLPAPLPGEPDEYRPPATKADAWVPMLSGATARDDEADLFGGARMVPNVIRAMSLVPDAVRLLKVLSAAHYIPMEDVPDPSASGGRALSRAQIELIAGRVSAMNDCFY